MKNLLFISFLAIILASCSRFLCINPHLSGSGSPNAVSGLFVSSDVRKFRTSLKFRNSEISGILVIKKLNDTITAGSFINEFGIKGFDFSISPGGVKITYLFKKLDKWYIRKRLGNDLHFLFLRPELKTECFVDNKPAFVKKISRSLSYVYFIPGDDKIERATMYKGNKPAATLEQSVKGDEIILLKMIHVKGSMSYEFTELKN